MKASLPLMESVLIPLAKSFLIPLGLPVRMSAADAAIQTKMHGLGTTTIIISNEKMEEEWE